MATFYEHIDEKLQAFIEKQHMFFVASAPLSAEGHVNVSPKGRDSLRVLSPNRVAYVDMIGSGNETSAHVLENGRITLMFCAFEGPANIVRLFGQGRTILPTDAEWAELNPLFPQYINTRQIIMAEIDKVQSSCGYAVPFMDFVSDRDTLTRWAENQGEDALEDYKRRKNLSSIDCLPTRLGAELAQQTPSARD